MSGVVLKIYMSPYTGGRLLPVSSVLLEKNKGIQGDRYHADKQSANKQAHHAKQDLTLIEAEEIETFNREQDVKIGYGEFRRNIVTRGIKLNTLIGKIFTINGIKLKGIASCQPCEDLAGLVHPAILPDMLHRAGLRAAILVSGEVKVGDSIQTEIP